MNNETDDKIGKYYKSFKDNSIIKVVKKITPRTFQVEIIDRGNWGIRNGIANVGEVNFNPTDIDYEYKEYTVYNTPLYKALNG